MRILAKLGILLILVVGGLAVGADFAARDCAEQQLAKRIEQAVPGSHATVRISSFPFLGRLALQGKVQKLTAKVTGVTAGSLPLSEVDVEVDGIVVNRSDLWRHRQVVLERVARGLATAVVTQAALDQATGLPIVLGSGTAAVTIGGVQMEARVNVVGGALELTPASGPRVRLSLPVLPVLPCVSTAVVDRGRMVLHCETTSIPPALVRAVAGG